MANTTMKGFAYGALAAASYGVNPLFTLPLYAREGMMSDSVLFYRYGLAVVLLAALALSKHNLKPKKLPRLF